MVVEVLLNQLSSHISRFQFTAFHSSGQAKTNTQATNQQAGLDCSPFVIDSSLTVTLYNCLEKWCIAWSVKKPFTNKFSVEGREHFFGRGCTVCWLRGHLIVSNVEEDTLPLNHNHMIKPYSHVIPYDDLPQGEPPGWPIPFRQILRYSIPHSC